MRKARERTRKFYERRGEAVPKYAQIDPGLPPGLFKPRTTVTDTGIPSGRSAAKIEEEAVEPVPPVVVESVAGVERFVFRPTWFVCDFCGDPCGPIVQLSLYRHRLLTRGRIWTSKGLASGGLLATAKEELRMELDPSRIRRPSGRFGWGWVDRRIMCDGYLTPMSQAEVVVYFFLCLVADRHGVSWYGPRALSRLVKHSPDEIREALMALARRNLIALAGRFVQVLDVEGAVPEPAEPTTRSAPEVAPSLPPSVPPPDPASASEELARLPHQQREDLLRHARERMARFLGFREPNASALAAVAVGLLRERGK